MWWGGGGGRVFFKFTWQKDSLLCRQPVTNVERNCGITSLSSVSPGEVIVTPRILITCGMQGPALWDDSVIVSTCRHKTGIYVKEGEGCADLWRHFVQVVLRCYVCIKDVMSVSVTWKTRLVATVFVMLVLKVAEHKHSTAVAAAAAAAAIKAPPPPTFSHF